MARRTSARGGHRARPPFSLAVGRWETASMQGVKCPTFRPAFAFPFPRSELWLLVLDLAILTVKNASTNREQNLKIFLQKKSSVNWKTLQIASGWWYIDFSEIILIIPIKSKSIFKWKPSREQTNITVYTAGTHSRNGSSLKRGQWEGFAPFPHGSQAGTAHPGRYMS